jgi:hypothetical protein
MMPVAEMTVSNSLLANGRNGDIARPVGNIEHPIDGTDAGGRDQ